MVKDKPFHPVLWHEALDQARRRGQATGRPSSLAGVSQNDLNAAGHAAAIAAGRDTYRQFCAPCHGADGKGHGPIAADLVVAPADLTQLKKNHKGTLPRPDIASMLMATSRRAPHSNQEMPLWGRFFVTTNGDKARTTVDEVIEYLESIQP